MASKKQMQGEFDSGLLGTAVGGIAGTGLTGGTILTVSGIRHKKRLRSFIGAVLVIPTLALSAWFGFEMFQIKKDIAKQ